MFGEEGNANPEGRPGASGAPVKVSVAMTTYNHERFIAQAIESVLMQKTDFAYELVIGEDCSTDHTRDTVSGYAKRYPDRIRLLLHEQNSGASRNIGETLRACQGEYVARLDGDDYWTSPYKLQKQVDLLEHNRELSMCFHATRWVFEDGSGRKPFMDSPPQAKPYYTLEDLLRYGCFIMSGSAMVRREFEGEWPEWARTIVAGDWVAYVFHAQHGKIGYIDEAMSVYRIHQAGAWSGRGLVERFEHEIERCKIVNANLGFKYDQMIKKQVSDLCYDLAVEHAKCGNLPEAAGAVLRGIMNNPLNKSGVIRLARFSLARTSATLRYALNKIGVMKLVRYWRHRC